MSLYLFLLFLLLLAGSFCVSLNDIPTVKVQQNTVATLPCPHKKGDVTWSRYRHGNPLILVTIKNGEEKRSDKRYGSLADNSLNGEKHSQRQLGHTCNRRAHL
ncbi:uncharacterized protein LOC117940569 isoform X2 [Etheostoma cragini]|uniref:uncharacterized protein LOC117940569 isoform X2 n=1 Tax=Etheostoma cragini TaxID=417921 RepID=UPI00155E569B|nr:uncharacterized protein LOC117940569 isoform X2 [Etheostoma cragini]